MEILDLPFEQKEEPMAFHSHRGRNPGSNPLSLEMDLLCIVRSKQKQRQELGRQVYRIETSRAVEVLEARWAAELSVQQT